MAQTTTGTNSPTQFIDNQGVYYPCWCGEDHRGDYAIEDWMMHHCTHSDPLVELERHYLVCGECGQVFHSRLPATPTGGAG